jgi:hypothetical protein
LDLLHILDAKCWAINARLSSVTATESPGSPKGGRPSVSDRGPDGNPGRPQDLDRIDASAGENDQIMRDRAIPAAKGLSGRARKKRVKPHADRTFAWQAHHSWLRRQPLAR